MRCSFQMNKFAELIATLVQVDLDVLVYGASRWRLGRIWETSNELVPIWNYLDLSCKSERKLISPLACWWRVVDSLDCFRFSKYRGMFHFWIYHSYSMSVCKMCWLSTFQLSSNCTTLSTVRQQVRWRVWPLHLELEKVLINEQKEDEVNAMKYGVHDPAAHPTSK